jgi:hypothetical protein
MKGTISFVSPRGFFFITVKTNPIGFITKYFGLRTRIIRGEENLAVGAICNFEELKGDPKFNGANPVAHQIDIESSSILPSLDGGK